MRRGAMIDFHNHLIPGVDDGAANLAEARVGLSAMEGQGVRTVVCTPHLLASLIAQPDAFGEYLARVDRGWEELRAMAAAEFPKLRLERGFEVMLDVPDPDLRDARVTLAGTRFVLVEFSGMAIPPNAAQAIFDLVMAGVTPVIAHPERYSNVGSDLSGPEAWKRAGALLQVNAGSLVGKYGATARGTSWALLRAGYVDFVCSDYHARGTLHLAAAMAELERAGAGGRAALLTHENPARMLDGESPLPVPPLHGVPLWRRILRVGR